MQPIAHILISVFRIIFPIVCASLVGLTFWVFVLVGSVTSATNRICQGLGAIMWPDRMSISICWDAHSQGTPTFWHSCSSCCKSMLVVRACWLSIRSNSRRRVEVGWTSVVISWSSVKLTLSCGIRDWIDFRDFSTAFIYSWWCFPVWKNFTRVLALSAVST